MRTLKQGFRFISFAACAATMLFSHGVDARDRSRPVKFPSNGWEKIDVDVGVTASEARRVGVPILVRTTVLETEPSDGEIAAIVKTFSGSDAYTVRSVIPPETLKEAELSRGMSLKLGNGKIAVYYALIRKRKDGRFAITSMLTTHLSLASDTEEQKEKKRTENANQFVLLRQLNNQIIRGAVAGYFQKPRIEYANLVTGNDVLFPENNTAATPAAPPKADAVKAKLPLPSQGTGTILPQPDIAAPPNTIALPPQTPINTASVGNAQRYPFMTNGNSGVGLSQVSAIIYAPLEFSEVYVLFKDGSFHENLPVALEDWDVGASKKGDPESWGKWKVAGKSGDYDLRYAGESDVVKINGAKIAPVAPGTSLEGTYVVSNPNTQKSDKTAITFNGNQFTFADKGLGEGTYQVQGYTITLSFSDGRKEHRPFFVVPKDEDDEEESEEQEQAIWFGDEVKVRV